MNNVDDSNSTNSSTHDSNSGDSWPWKKIGVGITLLVVFAVGLLFFRESLTLDALAQRESQLRRWQEQSPVIVFGLAFLIYVAVTGLSLPGAAGLSMVYAWFFGFWPAVLLVSFASAAGATVAFLISRFLFRQAVEQRFGKRMESFNRALEREGPFYLFTLRLIPAVPFFVINAVMGLTPIRAFTFWWVSQLGMLPGTVVYVFAGSSVPDLQTLADEGVSAVFDTWQLIQIFSAFALLSAFPWLARWLLKRFGPTTELPE